MGNRVKAWNALSRVLFILVFAASLAVFYLTRTGEGYLDFIINLIFDAVAAVFLICYFAGCARPLAKVTAALGRVTEDILRSDGSAKALWEQYGKNTAPFGNERLDERYGAYVRETRRLQKQNSLTADCRIEDYIDEELIYSTVNKPFCDQLGGIMSGLGILFTFIGLVYGLRSFDASTVELMQSSTQALMAGIKIAFLTSIFGLVYSLLFGLTYRKLLKDSIDALYDFQDAYTESVRPSNEHAAENAMIRLQMEQNAALEKFGTNIGDQVSEAIITLMGPTVDKLQNTITQYVTVAIEDQRAGMDKVVRYFLDSMNSSLGNIFSQLKNRTEELTRWEKDMIDSIGAMTAGMGKTGQELAQAQACAQKIVEGMSAYTATIESLTAAQTGVIRDMRSLMADYRQSHEQEAAYIQSLSAAAEGAAKNTEQSLRVAQAVADIAAQVRSGGEAQTQHIADAGQQITQAAQSARAMAQTIATDVDAAAARLERAAGDLEGGLSRSISDSVSVIDDSIAKLNGSLAGVTAAADTVSQALRTLPKTVSSADGDIKATARVIDTELKLLLKAVSDTQKILNKFNAELEHRIDR